MVENTEKGQFMFGVANEALEHKSQVTLIFNALNGMFLSATNIPYSMCDQSDPLCIYISDEMDIALETVVGGLTINPDKSWTANYQIVNTAEYNQNTVTEGQLDSAVAYKITKEYPVVKQINVIANALKEISEKIGHPLPELEEYLDYVKLVKDTNKRHKEFYMNDSRFNYISKEKVNEDYTKLHEGGLHERIGPRDISNGIVF